jgi:hypothetical protein
VRGGCRPRMSGRRVGSEVETSTRPPKLPRLVMISAFSGSRARFEYGRISSDVTQRLFQPIGAAGCAAATGSSAERQRDPGRSPAAPALQGSTSPSTSDSFFAWPSGAGFVNAEAGGGGVAPSGPPCSVGGGASAAPGFVLDHVVHTPVSDWIATISRPRPSGYPLYEIARQRGGHRGVQNSGVGHPCRRCGPCGRGAWRPHVGRYGVGGAIRSPVPARDCSTRGYRR